ncbi:hypothetical protein C0L75_03120 [Clostridium perfringens]|mgnify:CR=1 FL=1
MREMRLTLLLEELQYTEKFIDLLIKYESVNDTELLVKITDDEYNQIELIEHIGKIFEKRNGQTIKLYKNLLYLIKEMNYKSFPWKEKCTEEEISNGLQYVELASEIEYLNYLEKYLENVLQYIEEDNINEVESEEVKYELSESMKTQVEFFTKAKEKEKIQEVADDPEEGFYVVKEIHDREWFLIVHKENKTIEKAEIEDIKLRELDKETFTLDILENLGNYREGYKILLHYDDLEKFNKSNEEPAFISVDKYLKHFEKEKEKILNKYLV